MQAAIARGVDGDELKFLGEAVVRANDDFKSNAKHVRMHIAPAKTAKPKGQAKAKAAAA